MQDLTIGEVARYAGIQPSAIRYYERVGLILPPRRVNGYRRYDLSVLKRLGLLHLLRRAGFGIRELQVLFSAVHTDAPASDGSWQTLAAAKIADLEARIQQAQATKAWLVEAVQRDCTSIEECIMLTVDERGPGMQVTLSCEASSRNSASGARLALPLLTLPPPLTRPPS